MHEDVIRSLSSPSLSLNSGESSIFSFESFNGESSKKVAGSGYFIAII